MHDSNGTYSSDHSSVFHALDSIQRTTLLSLDPPLCACVLRMLVHAIANRRHNPANSIRSCGRESGCKPSHAGQSAGHVHINGARVCCHFSGHPDCLIAHFQPALRQHLKLAAGLLRPINPPSAWAACEEPENHRVSAKRRLEASWWIMEASLPSPSRRSHSAT